MSDYTFYIMKISYNWLKEYVDIDLAPQEVAEILTETGLEVESVDKIEAVKGGLNGVVVAEILTCEKHANADKLKVTTVTIGSDPIQVVCGAPNVAVGQKVLLATVGTTLYPNPENPLVIKSTTIRGVESNGMLCAEDELGLGESHAGILVLDTNIAVGTPAAKVFDLEDDYVLEIGLTPNRTDAMGHIGVVRDLVAYLNFHRKANLQIKFPNIDFSQSEEISENVKISIEDSILCPRYAGVVLKNVEVKPSPSWLQKRLRAVGLSPINNIVDATNYVMREWGSPLHAFDLSALKGNIVVRKAIENELITTLDGIERKLSANDLVIANDFEPLCIAGVFGGKHSGVSDQTKAVFIESAYFNAVSVRKTAKLHGLNTDASFRFERGADPEIAVVALKRVVKLILDMAGGNFALPIQDYYPTEILRNEVKLNIKTCNRLIGIEISKEEILSILSTLDFEIKAILEDDLLLTVPSYRVDVTREVDVIEEILRIYGFNQVPIPAKMNASLTAFTKPDHEKIQKTIAELLVSKGFYEIMNNSLIAESYVQKFGGSQLIPDRNVPILNPLSNELNVMRQSLLFGMGESIAHNQNRQSTDLKLFEFGKVYHNFNGNYVENRRLIYTMMGKKSEESWNSPRETVTFFSAKGIASAIFNRLGLDALLIELELSDAMLRGGLELKILKRKVGEIGMMSTELRKHFGIKQDVFVADLDWDAILESIKMVKIQFKELPKTFAVRRDFSLLLDNHVSFADIRKTAMSSDKSYLKNVQLFDVYEGDKLPAGKKSYAVSFTFQDAQHTMKDETIDELMSKIFLQLQTNFKAELR